MTRFTIAQAAALEKRERSGFIRVGAGGGPGLHINDTHACIGIVSVEAVPYAAGEQIIKRADGTIDRSEGCALRVMTDFEQGIEETRKFGGVIDAQLAVKGVLVGGSGGMSKTDFWLTATRPLPTSWRAPNGDCYMPGSILPPQGGWANFATDNICVFWDGVIVRPPVR